MGCLFVIVLGGLSAVMIFFFGYTDWVLIVLGLLWLASIVVSALRGHVGFGGRGNTDLQVVIAALLLATLVTFPDYLAQKHCDQARTALTELAEAQAKYFAARKTYTTGLDHLSLTPDPNIQIKMIVANEKSFIASASHRLCDKDKDGAPEILIWDSSRGGLQ